MSPWASSSFARENFCSASVRSASAFFTSAASFGSFTASPPTGPVSRARICSRAAFSCSRARPSSTGTILTSGRPPATRSPTSTKTCATRPSTSEPTVTSSKGKRDPTESTVRWMRRATTGTMRALTARVWRESSAARPRAQAAATAIDITMASAAAFCPPLGLGMSLVRAPKSSGFGRPARGAGPRSARGEGVQVGDAELLLDARHLLDRLLEAPGAEAAALLRLEVVAQLLDFPGADDPVEGREQHGVLARLVWPVHADEGLAGADDLLAGLRTAE